MPNDWKSTAETVRETVKKENPLNRKKKTRKFDGGMKKCRHSK